MPPWLGPILEFQAASNNSILQASLEKQRAEQQVALKKQRSEQQAALEAQKELYEEQLGRLEKKIDDIAGEKTCHANKPLPVQQPIIVL